VLGGFVRKSRSELISTELQGLKKRGEDEGPGLVELLSWIAVTEAFLFLSSQLLS
jgi:hypothetical protein